MSDVMVLEFRGAVIVEWPAKGDRSPGILPGWGISIYDVPVSDSAEPVLIKTVSRMEIRADAQELITVDLTMLAGEDGEPLRDGPPVMKDGEILTGTFPFLVAEMRVRQ